MLLVAEVNPAVPIIQFLVAPVVMISACGLLCLALYNRLATIVNRLRGFHHERYLTHQRLSATPLEEQTGPAAMLARQRQGTLDEQIVQVLARARLVRNALVGLLASVLCMLSCSLAIGLSMLVESLWVVALGLFVLGVLAMALGVTLAMAELARALHPVTLEMASMERE